MLKQEFLSKLEEGLKELPQVEKERIMNYYNETLEDAMEDGLSEEQAVPSIKDLQHIIDDILEEHKEGIQERKSPEKPGMNRNGRYAILVLSSPFWMTGVMLIVTLYLTFIALLASLALLNLALVIFILTGILNLASIIIVNLASGIVLLGFIFIALGVLPYGIQLMCVGFEESKNLYHKGMLTGKAYWKKAVA